MLQLWPRISQCLRRSNSQISQSKTILTRSSALAVGEKLVHRVDQAFDIRLRDEGGGAGRERFAPVNLIRVAGVEDARYRGGDRHQCLAQLDTCAVGETLVEHVKIVLGLGSHSAGFFQRGRSVNLVVFLRQ